MTTHCWSTIAPARVALEFWFSCDLIVCVGGLSSGERDHLPAGHYWVALCGAKWRGPDPDEWMRCALLLRSYCISCAVRFMILWFQVRDGFSH
eukprot:5827084-Amphidinium_carterae.1